jgi:hypothetical protein
MVWAALLPRHSPARERSPPALHVLVPERPPRRHRVSSRQERSSWQLEDGQLDLASAFDAPFVREHGGMATAAAAILRKTDWPAIDGIEQLPWKGTPPLTRRPPTVAGPGWFAAGDAAGYIEPFTGEGIAWALASALALAPLAAEASVAGSQRAHAAAWRSRHARLLGPRVRRCGIIAACLRRPRMVAAAVRLLGVFPWFARPIVSGLNRSVALKRG